MTRQVTFAIFGGFLLASTARGQIVQQDSMASKYVDPVAGLTLDDAIARAVQQEPALRAARTGIEAARGLRLQAGLRPNPMVSLEQREEPSGMDRQTSVMVEWPLDLFRKGARVAVADRELQAVQHSVADRERLLATEIRMRYGEVAVFARELIVVDDVLAATRQQHDLLRSRVDEGASPRVERDMLRVELHRLEADRLLQAGHAEHAMIELKRLLGLSPDTALTLKDTIEQLVARDRPAPIEAAPTFAASARADVREAAARVALAEARIERARRDGGWDLSFFGSYMRMDASFPQNGFNSRGDLEQVHGVFNYVAGGATVMLPLRNRNQGEIAAAEAERAGAVARQEAAQLAARSEVASANARDQHARRAVAAYGADALRLARLNLEVVAQAYELGRATVFDVLAERRRYLDVERSYTAALREAYEATTALKGALGEVR